VRIGKISGERPSPPMSERDLTRRAMYELVWSQPMTKVAEGFGISDVALKKICDKHRVPTPTRGYWAKKVAGKRIRQTPFHETSDGGLERIVIHGRLNNLPTEVQKVLADERERRKARPRS